MTSEPAQSKLASDLAAARAERASLTKQLSSLQYAADLTRAEASRRLAASSPPASPAARGSSTSPKADPLALEATLLAEKARSAAARARVQELEVKVRALRRRVKATGHLPAAIAVEDTPGVRRMVPATSPSMGRSTLSVSPTRRAAGRNIADVDALVRIAGGEGGDDFLPCRVSVSAAGVLNIYPVADVETNSEPDNSDAGRYGLGPRGPAYKGQDDLVERLLSSPRSRPLSSNQCGGDSVNASEPVLTLSPPFKSVGELERVDASSTNELLKWFASLPVVVINKGGIPTNMLLCGLQDAVLHAEALVRDRTSSPMYAGKGQPKIELPPTVKAVLSHRSSAGEEGVAGVIPSRVERRGEPGDGDGEARRSPSAASERNALPPPQISFGAPSETRRKKPNLRQGQARTEGSLQYSRVSTAKSFASSLSARLGAFGFGTLSSLGSGSEEEIDEGPRGHAGVMGTGTSSSEPHSTRHARGRGRVEHEGETDGVDSSMVVAMVDGAISAVLREKEILALVRKVPSRFTTSPALRLLYSTRVHGTSLQTLYSRGYDRAPTLLAVRNELGERFGCFVTTPWEKSAHATYYGNGESFCWKVASESEGELSGVQIYKWSRKNKYFQCSTASFIALGGGGGFALRLDEDLIRGSSGACETYSSPGLATRKEFDCLVVELWGVETARYTHSHRT